MDCVNAPLNEDDRDAFHGQCLPHRGSRMCDDTLIPCGGVPATGTTRL
jgi:hypothetical protein